MTNKIHDLLFEQYGHNIFKSNLMLEASTLSYVLSPLKSSTKNNQIIKTTIKEVIKNLGITADAPIIPIKDFHNQFLYNELTCGNVVIIIYKDNTKQIIKRNYGTIDKYRNQYGAKTFIDNSKIPLTRTELGLPHGAKIGEPMNTFRRDVYYSAPYTRIQINDNNSIRKISNVTFEDPKNINKRITGYRAMQHWIGYGDAGDNIGSSNKGRRSDPTDAIKQVFVIPFYHLTNNQFNFDSDKIYIDHPHKIPFPIFCINIIQYLNSKYNDEFIIDDEEKRQNIYSDLAEYIIGNESMYAGEYIILKNKNNFNSKEKIGKWLDFTNSHKNDYRNTISENINMFLINALDSTIGNGAGNINNKKYKTADSKSLINDKLIELLSSLKNVISNDPNSEDYYEIKTKLLATKDLISRCLKSKMVPKLGRLYTRLNYYNSLIERKNNLIKYIDKRDSMGFKLSEPKIKSVNDGQNKLNTLNQHLTSNIIEKENILYQMAILQLKDIESTIKKKDLNKERLSEEIDYILDNIDVSKIYEGEVKLKKTIKQIEKLYIKIIDITIKAKEECDKIYNEGKWKLSTYKVQYSNRLLPIKKLEDQINKLKESIKDEYELLELDIKKSALDHHIVQSGDKNSIHIDPVIERLLSFKVQTANWSEFILWRPSHPALTKLLSDIKLKGEGVSYVLGNIVDALEEYNIHTNSEITPIKEFISRNTKKGTNIDDESIKDYIHSDENKNKKILWIDNDYIHILTNINDNKARQANILLSSGESNSNTIYLDDLDLSAKMFIITPPKIPLSRSSYSSGKYLEYLNIVHVVGDGYYYNKLGTYIPISITKTEKDEEYDPDDPFNL
jgi:hypothetical protein